MMKKMLILIFPLVLLFSFHAYADELPEDTLVTDEPEYSEIEDEHIDSDESDAIMQEVLDRLGIDDYDELEDDDETVPQVNNFLLLSESPETNSLPDQTFFSSEDVESSSIGGGSTDVIPSLDGSELTFASFTVEIFGLIADMLMSQPYIWFTGMFLLAIAIGLFRKIIGR